MSSLTKMPYSRHNLRAVSRQIRSFGSTQRSSTCTSPKGNSLSRAVSMASFSPSRAPKGFVLALGTTFGLLIGISLSTTLGWIRQSSEVPAVLDPKRLPNIKYASLPEMQQAIEEIRHEIGDDEDIISTDSDDLLAHGFSEWSSVNLDTLPVAVAYPRCTEDVSKLVRICHKWRVPVIPFSGGSSLEGHTAAPFGGLSIDFAFMDKVLEYHHGDMDVVVQPGLCWTDLNEELAKRGSDLFFPMDPAVIERVIGADYNSNTAPSAKIGGMIGTNCSGTNAVRYGTMRDWVINVTMVLADGSVIKTRRRPRKCSSGMNLNGIIVGSEGTLGIVTEATLKLAPIPESFSVAVVPFPDIKSAVSAATTIVRKGVPVAALELMDEVQMRVVNQGGLTRPRLWKETPTLFLKFSGTEGTVRDSVQAVQRIVKDFHPCGFEFAHDEREQKLLWSARKESLYSLLALRKDGEEVWTTDVAVPLSRLAEVVEISKREAEALGLNASVKGHVGDGNFHENITYNKTIPEERQKAETAVKNMVARAVDMDGTCTGEHGVGFGKKAGLVHEVGPATITVMKLLKSTLDPRWIMNPGKVYDL